MSDTPLATDRELHPELRVAIRNLCRRFPDEYWRTVDKNRE